MKILAMRWGLSTSRGLGQRLCGGELDIHGGWMKVKARISLRRRSLHVFKGFIATQWGNPENLERGAFGR
jgi:hypothetical protein